MDNIRILEYDELYNDVEELKREISRLIGERDELVFVICENIKTKYMLEVGALEYKLYEAGCLYRRLKRKLQMIRATLNSQEKVDLQKIELCLDEEMEEYKRVLADKMQAFNDALARLDNKALSQEQAKELKSLYHKIVKELHPDLHPDISPEKAQLFLKAVMAYKNGDLATIRLISEMVSDPITESKESTYADLLMARERLFESMNVIKNDIEQSKSRFPYSAKEFLEDEEALSQRKLELEGAIFDHGQKINELEERIKEITK